MTTSGLALFLLLAQNATPQQPSLPAAPAVPAAIEGVVAKSVTGESLARVTVTLTETRTSPAAITQLLLPGISPNSAEFVQLQSALLNPTSNIAVSAPVTQTTMSDGKFLFENLKPGTYSLKATLGGYSTAEYGQRGPNSRGMTFTLKAGQKMQGVSLTMTPGGTITGHVVDANGDPLSRAMVQAQKLVYQQNGRALVTVQTVPADDRGEYRLFWLPPGQYYISATPPDERMRTMQIVASSLGGSNPVAINALPAAVRDVLSGMAVTGIAPGMKVTGRTSANGDAIEEADVPVFYPSALDISASTPVEIRPGGLSSGIDITMKPARVFRIHGTILNSATSQPVPATQVTLLPRSGTITSQGSSIPQAPNSSGFDIAGVVPGSYLLMVGGTVGAGQLVTAISPIEVQGANLENVIITASPSFAINGHISGATTTVTANPQTFIIQMEPQLSGVPPAMVLGNRLQVRQDNFVLPIAVSTDYRVSVTSPPNTYVQSIRFGGQDVLRDGLHIDGPSNETLEVVISPNAGRVEGDVNSERQKFPNATVVLVPSSSLRQQSSLYQTVQSNAEGHFAFESVTPGTYKLFAWEDVETFAWFDADFMRSYESRGTEIVIREGAKEKIELTVIPR